MSSLTNFKPAEPRPMTPNERLMATSPPTAEEIAAAAAAKAKPAAKPEPIPTIPPPPAGPDAHALLVRCRAVFDDRDRAARGDAARFSVLGRSVLAMTRTLLVEGQPMRAPRWSRQFPGHASSIAAWVRLLSCWGAGLASELTADDLTRSETRWWRAEAGDRLEDLSESLIDVAADPQLITDVGELAAYVTETHWRELCTWREFYRSYRPPTKRPQEAA